MAGGVKTWRIGARVVAHEPIEPTYCRYAPPWTYGEVIAEEGRTASDGSPIYVIKRVPDPRRRLQCVERGT